MRRSSIGPFTREQRDRENNGGSLLGQKNYSGAEPLLLAGYEGMKEREAKIPPQGKIRLTEAIQRLVDLYDAWGQKEKADERRKNLEAEKPLPKDGRENDNGPP